MSDKQSTVDPVDHTALALRKDWAVESRKALLQLPCDASNEAWWAGKLQLVQAELNANEADRTLVTGPINKDLKRINGAYKPVTDALEQLKACIKSKLAGAAQARLAAQDAARLAAVVAAQAGDAAGCQAALAAIPEDASLGGASTRFEWVALLEDFAKVPDAYKTLADIVIDAHINCTPKGEEPKPIPGIIFERRPIVRVKPNRSKK